MKLKSETLKNHCVSFQKCMKCPLGAFSPPSDRVFYSGPNSPDILFVGDSPSESDICTGSPFMGPAGDLLHQIIAESIPNTKVGFTTSVACAARDSRAGNLRQAKKIELASCSVRLQNLINIINPGCLVAVGKIAESTLKMLDFPFKTIIHPNAIIRKEEAGIVDIKRIKIILLSVEH